MEAPSEADRLVAVLADRVRALRTEQGLTLQALARRAGLSPRFLVQVEQGIANISVRKLAGLAGALETTAVALLAAPAPAGSRRRRTLPTVALLGLRGAGKSTVGRRLARRLRVPFVELDRKVEEAAGMSLAEVFALHGEGYYRRLEREALDGVLAEGAPLVLATGGGLPASPETYDALRARALTVWLRAAPEDHWNRVVQQGDRRPMADHPEAMAELRRLLSAREPLYAQAAVTVDTSRLGVEGAAEAIVRLVRGGAPSGTASARPR
jgi:XRE family transcriptional regulator, aerobic/anaerobic benzoate catabolism transcriptional regulator